ncbi:uncharacterized protein LOC135846580 isoform X2 [Planococcus citri]|uniref:uncharacterized protein LOC135846580 isoform X2 n=1 Tax=Planococcus citri TaxID=170843 RepID=UPI0031FA2F41
MRSKRRKLFVAKHGRFYYMMDGACTTHLLLETIMEETSDDLRSETSGSEYNSGLLTDSMSTVIHVPSYEKNLHTRNGRNLYWNGSGGSGGEINTDPGVHDDDNDSEEDDFTDELDDSDSDSDSDDSADSADSSDSHHRRGDDLGGGLPSRTSSLLQFENLEKHCETIFSKSRPSKCSEYGSSFENKNARTWSTSSKITKSSSQPENLNHFSSHQHHRHDIDDDNDSSSLSSPCSSSSSEMISSDEMLSSSYSSKYNSLPRKSSLRSFRSVDSLTSLQQKREKEQDLLNSMDLSQSLTDDLARLSQEEPEEIPVPARGIYKTMECLSEIQTQALVDDDHVNDEDENDHERSKQSKTNETTKVVRRSAENLSEDSGFGDHVSVHKRPTADESSTIVVVVEEARKVIENSIGEEGCDVVDGVRNQSDAEAEAQRDDEDEEEEELQMTTNTVDDDVDQNDAKFNQQCWQSDPNLLDATYVIETEQKAQVSQQSEECTSTMSSRLPVVSTPNLYNTDEEYHYKGIADDTEASSLLCNESTVSLSRIYSLKRINFGSEGKLSTTSSRGSNVQITTSFINLTTNTSYGSNKGVHFCPVVSEVSWQESSGTEEEEDEEDDRLEEEEISISESDSRAEYSAGDEEEIRLLRPGDLYSRVDQIKDEERDTSSDSRSRDATPPIDELVEKLLSESVSKQARESEKQRLRQAQQRARLDFITSPPPKRGSIAHVMQQRSSSGNENDAVNNNNSSTPTANNQVYNSSSTSHHSNANANVSFAMANDHQGAVDSVANNTTKDKSSSKSSSSSKIGGFLQRFSLKRLSGRKKSKKSGSSSNSSSLSSSSAPPVVVGCVPKEGYVSTSVGEPNSRIVPLSDDGGEYDQVSVSVSVVSSKPPLPPSAPARWRPSNEGSPPPAQDPPGGAPPRSGSGAAAATTTAQAHQLTPAPRGGGHSNATNMLRNTHANIDPNTGIGLLETDIDSNVTSSTSAVNRAANSSSSPSPSPSSGGGNKKSRSLLNLDNGRMSIKQLTPDDRAIKPSSPHHHACNDYRAKSMEFLLDKENQAAIKPPENELQKGNGEKKMSEHELRVQRSLQKLNIPEWYKNSTVPAQGFLLKRHSDAGQNAQSHQHQRWNASTLPSKTTSLSSLGSTLSTTPRSPTSGVLTSPSPTHYAFSRWSTSRLNSGTNSSSTSPCGSARSSFNYRQPYLGWRSQEKLSKPRTPAERLAAGLLPQYQNGSQQSSPSLTEVRTSIKEVTSAIVHYVSGTRESSDRLSPSLRLYADSSSRSTSPRGSTGRLCWLESSFVGSRPLSVPETPSSATADEKTKTIKFEKEPTDELYLNYSANNTQKCNENQTFNNQINGKASSTNKADWKPGSQSQFDIKRRRSEGSALLLQKGVQDRRISYDIYADPVKPMSTAQSNLKLVVQCRYPKCGKTAEPAEAKRSFKVCHNCDYVYCSRECRREHWEKHRKVCLHSRVGELCRRVLSTIKQNEDILLNASTVARRGFLTHGRGCVKFYFHSPQLAEQFANGAAGHPDPVYIKWTNLLPTEMGNDLYAELLRICKSYNPDTRLVIFVAIHVVSEVPTRGAVKWERQIISRCAKTKLSPALTTRNPSLCNLSKESEYPETLILTSLPGSQGTQKDRQVSFTNIQRHLRQRGVSLRKQFPEVYKKLCNYVEGTDNFTPITIYPVDSASGKNFMCVIMPDAEPEKLNLIPKDNFNVKTIDVSKLKNSPSEL